MILLQETDFPILSSSLAIIFFTLYAIGRKKPRYRYLVIPYFILYLIAIVIVWYLTGGIVGHTLLYFVSLVMIVPIFIHNKKRIYAIAGCFILILSLFLFELSRPELIQSIYETKKLAAIDTFITGTFLTIITGFVMMLVLYGYEQQKQKADKLSIAKDKFFSIIAHDLRGPIASLIHLGQMLMDHDKDLDPKNRKEFIKHIYTCSNETHYLLENLLLWARSESKDLSINPATLNLLSCIDNSSKVLMESLRQKEIALSIDVKEEHTVFADKNMLMVIVRNLLSNAIKYTEKGGQISISSSVYADNQLRLIISDNGIGISECRKSMLFDCTTNQSTKGTNNELGSGLGLNICKDFIIKNNGQIALESKLNKGTSIIVSLPTCPN